MPLNLFRLLATRTLVLWVSIRVIYIWVIRVTEIGFVPNFSISTQIVLIVAILYLIDMTRRRERLLLANLGLSRRYIIATVGLVTACAEILLSVYLGMVTR